MSIQRCLLRIADKGDLCWTKIDVKNCELGLSNWKCLNIFNIDLSAFVSWDFVCEKAIFIPARIIKLMFKLPQVRLAIDYNKIGVILLTDMHLSNYNFVEGYIGWPKIVGKSVFNVSTKDIGIVKAKIYTYEIFQTLTRLIVFEEANRIWTLSYRGVIPFDETLSLAKFEENPKLKLSKLVDIPEIDPSKLNYALAVYDGKEVLVYLDTIKNEFMITEVKV